MIDWKKSMEIICGDKCVREKIEGQVPERLLQGGVLVHSRREKALFGGWLYLWDFPGV